MGMFSWRSTDGRDPTSRASPDFWIYWAVAVPLTIITIAGWATWWKIEMRRSDREARSVAQGSLKKVLDLRTSRYPEIDV